MAGIDRRTFLRNTAATAGASLVATQIVPSRAGLESHSSTSQVLPSTSVPTLDITIRGLCVFVRRKNKSIDVVLMNHEQRAKPGNGPVIHEHAARLLTDEGRVIEKSDGAPVGGKLIAWPLRGYCVSISPSGRPADTEVATASVDHPWQASYWLLNLKRAFPGGKLIGNLADGGNNRAAAVMQLSGGRLEGMVPSSGLGNLAVWKITSQGAAPETWQQGLTDQVLYRLPLPAGTQTVTISRKAMTDRPAAAAAVKDIVLAVPESDTEPLTLSLDHTFRAEKGHGVSGDRRAMPHNVVFYDVFSNSPSLGPIPKRVQGVGERLPLSEQTIERLQANDADPYCNVGFYDEIGS